MRARSPIHTNLFSFCCCCRCNFIGWVYLRVKFKLIFSLIVRIVAAVVAVIVQSVFLFKEINSICQAQHSACRFRIVICSICFKRYRIIVISRSWIIVETGCWLINETGLVLCLMGSTLDVSYKTVRIRFSRSCDAISRLLIISWYRFFRWRRFTCPCIAFLWAKNGCVILKKKKNLRAHLHGCWNTNYSPVLSAFRDIFYTFAIMFGSFYVMIEYKNKFDHVEHCEGLSGTGNEI